MGIFEYLAFEKQLFLFIQRNVLAILKVSSDLPLYILHVIQFYICSRIFFSILYKIDNETNGCVIRSLIR